MKTIGMQDVHLIRRSGRTQPETWGPLVSKIKDKPEIFERHRFPVIEGPELMPVSDRRSIERLGTYFYTMERKLLVFGHDTRPAEKSLPHTFGATIQWALKLTVVAATSGQSISQPVMSNQFIEILLALS